MSLYHKAKRIVKLGLVCVAAYYVAKTCNRVAFSQDHQQGTIDELVTTRDTVRTMDDTTVRPARETERTAQYH
ncbi:hypothetical protein GF367_02575 [Candidatus Woesearchaeota archaeon]|nr:hypothetical protein [Candidatus Woesearchaeota archaeon]